MIKSNLTSKVVLADSSNYNKGRFGYKVCKITPHHMAGKLSGEQCAKLFQDPNRNASANYCIGNDGDIVCNVSEENRAWTSSSKSNDCQAITIEVSNCENGGEWRISEKAWISLVNLCVDICRRYNFKLVYDGTSNGSLTRHNMFAKTDCPGKYLQSKFPELAEIVNSRLEENNSTTLKYKVGDVVNITGVYVSSTSNNKLRPAITKGTITKIISSARNPYLLDNGNIGWVNDECIVSNNIKYLSNKNYKGTSIVDALNQIKVDSSYNYRAKLAKNNGISNYTGTASQNTKMLELLKKGTLKTV